MVRDPIVQNFARLEPEPLDTSDLLAEERPLPHPIVDFFTLPKPTTSASAASDSPTATAAPAPAPLPVPAPVSRDPRVDPRTEARPTDPRVDPRVDPRLVDPRVERRAAEAPKKSTLSELTDEDLIRKAETQIAEQMASEAAVPLTLVQAQPPPPGMENEVGYSTATPPPMTFPPPVRPSPFAPDLSLTAGTGYLASSDPPAAGGSLGARASRAPRSPPPRAGQTPSDSAGSRRRRSYSGRHGRDSSSDSSDSDSSDASGSSGKSSGKRSSRWSDGKPPSPSERKRSRSRERHRDRDKDRDRRDKRARDHSRDWEYDHRERRDRTGPFPPGPSAPGGLPAGPPGPVGPMGPMPPGRPMMGPMGPGWDRGRFRGGFPGRGMFRGRGDFRKGGPGRQWNNRGPPPPGGPTKYHGDIHDNTQFEGDIRNFEKHRARTMKMRRKEPTKDDKSWER